MKFERKTKTKFKFSILPKTCDLCRSVIWLEHIKQMKIPSKFTCGHIKLYYCNNCWIKE